MKRLFAISLGLALCATVLGHTVSEAQSDLHASDSGPGSQIDVTYFYSNLAPDGQWFQDPNYGWCWTPYDVPADWRPYSNGHWEYTDYGWSWASDESWGWATYHYGRWFFDDSYGWAWVPGTEWAPAWVAWRTGDDWVGWAALPPTAGWNDSAGLTFADANAIPSQEWCFVPSEHLLDASLTLQVTSVGRNVTLLGRSNDATRFEVREGRPADVGIDVVKLEAQIGQPVARVRIVDADSPENGRGRLVDKGTVGFFRPKFQSGSTSQVAAPSAAQRGADLSDADLQRQRDAGNKKLESDLAAEHARLLSDQQKELRSQTTGPAADDLRKRHVVEQQAFDAHAAQQRQVLAQRIQKRVIRPARADNAGKDDKQPKGEGGNKPGK